MKKIKLKNLKIEHTVKWDEKELRIISELNKFFEREYGVSWFLTTDEKNNEYFLISNINDVDAKIYKTKNNEYIIIDTTDINSYNAEYYTICEKCNLKELITTRLHLYISYGYGSNNSVDSIIGDSKMSWEQYADYLII